METLRPEVIRAIDERLASPAELARWLAAFEEVIARRLLRFRRRANLVTYEGSMLDRLALHFVERCWRPKLYSLVCSVRPCMLPALVDEVERFAASRRLPLVGFESDCPARHPWETGTRTCENIGQYIYRSLRGTDGLLVTSALTNADTGGRFSVINESYSELYVFRSPELADHRQPGPNHTWSTLFLFEGYWPTDVLLAYLYFVKDALEVHHLPVCYLDCYNERQQRKLIALVQSRKQQALDCLPRRQ